MVSVDPFFVPTRSSMGKNLSYETISFDKKMTEKVLPNNIKRENFSKNITEDIDMKKARFEVYKFAQNALSGEEKHKSKIELAIKLGAKPPKKQYKNYKALKEEIRKDTEEAEKNTDLNKFQRKYRISLHKSKINKGTLKMKRKIGSGILNEYGKATLKKQKKRT